MRSMLLTLMLTCLQATPAQLERIEGRMNRELVAIEAIRQQRDFWCGVASEYMRPEDIRHYGRCCKAWSQHTARLFAMQARLWSLIHVSPGKKEPVL